MWKRSGARARTSSTTLAPASPVVEGAPTQPRQRRGPEDRLIVAEVSVYRRVEQPQLEDDQEQHGAQDAVQDGGQLLTGPGTFHRSVPSTRALDRSAAKIVKL